MMYCRDTNMLKRRKERNTYLTTFCRHCWSAQMTMKKDNLLELSASTVAFISRRGRYVDIQNHVWKTGFNEDKLDFRDKNDNPNSFKIVIKVNSSYQNMKRFPDQRHA